MANKMPSIDELFKILNEWGYQVSDNGEIIDTDDDNKTINLQNEEFDLQIIISAIERALNITISSKDTKSALAGKKSDFDWLMEIIKNKFPESSQTAATEALLTLE